MDATLGERELDIMSALWRDGPGTVAEVRNRLPAKLAYNTVLTILRNLESKGFVDHTAEGRLFRYAPAVTEYAVQRGALSRLVEKLFSGSLVQVVAHLVEDEKLTPAELKDLHGLLDARRGQKAPRNTSVAKKQKPRRRA
jgi:BlaI family transcriptional regulator, penicillinase repressor